MMFKLRYHCCSISCVTPVAPQTESEEKQPSVKEGHQMSHSWHRLLGSHTHQLCFIGGSKRSNNTRGLYGWHFTPGVSPTAPHTLLILTSEDLQSYFWTVGRHLFTTYSTPGSPKGWNLGCGPSPLLPLYSVLQLLSCVRCLLLLRTRIELLHYCSVYGDSVF